MTPEPSGCFTFVLHSHLPYVINHGEWPHGMDWLYEAAAETYIPLWRELQSLADEGIHTAVTLGITPVLGEQLITDNFRTGMNMYLDQKIMAADEDRNAFRQEKKGHLSQLAEMWFDFYSGIKVVFNDDLAQDIIAGFRRLQDQGTIEIITSAATHGYLPLLGSDSAVNAQVKTGLDSYRALFGRDPLGIWLPECAYRPRYEWQPPAGAKTGDKPVLRAGIEEIFYEHGLQYFIVDAHLVKGGEARGVYIDKYEGLRELWARFKEGYQPRPEEFDRSVFQPYIVSSSGTTRGAAVLARHEDSALQVWSGEWGYPGHPDYLDFHKKHFPGGHKYWRVTGSKVDLSNKEEYQLEWVENRLEEQAGHFVGLVESALAQYKTTAGKPGILTAPFDTELFGHWWFEGPRWLGKVLRKLHDSTRVKPTHAGSYLEENPPHQTISLPEGSWGEGGFHYIWLNDWTEWSWPLVYEAEDIMTELAEKYARTRSANIKRILNQAARELLLLESSDWQFLISTWSARDYAEARLSLHKGRFDELVRMVETVASKRKLKSSQKERLQWLEAEDQLFRDIDFRHWRKYRVRP